jgi:hypothetical protein
MMSLAVTFANQVHLYGPLGELLLYMSIAWQNLVGPMVSAPFSWLVLTFVNLFPV